MIDIDAILEQLCVLWAQAVAIWHAGGWCMPALAGVALVMFALGVHVHMQLGEKGFLSVTERTWRSWINHPNERQGSIGEVLDFVTGGKTLKDTSLFFREPVKFAYRAKPAGWHPVGGRALSGGALDDKP